MARRLDNRVLTVSVVGLSGTEKDKGVTGIGKSCLCNRFIDPRADNYHTDHISVLSQSDFGGQVVNNDHFLYWGDVSKISDEGLDHSFRVLEQTEFVDDSSFQPFKCGKTEPYYKRCAQIRLQSAEKLMYISKTQLGLEHEFEQVLLPDGRLLVDGFLCVFDVSLVPQRSLDRQLDYTALILTNLIKTKKPVVLVTTKNDEAQESYVREVEKLLARKEFRNCTIPIVETSAHENVNVDVAFLTLAQLIDKTSGKTRLKIAPYPDASRIQKERREVAREAYRNLIHSHVSDHKALWTSILCKIRQDDNYILFQDLCGTDQARKLFQKHMGQLKEQYLLRRRDQYLEQLSQLLKVLLPDLQTIADRSWPSTLYWLRNQEFFNDYFVQVPNGGCWRSTEFIDSSEERIPFDLLELAEAEKVFRNHLHALRAEQKRNDLMLQFKHLLEKNQNLTGKSLEDTAIFFLGHQCFSGLSEEDKTHVYEQHQEQLRELARGNFIELLQERAQLFSKYEMMQVTEDDISDITSCLQDDYRYRAMSRLDEDRRVILLNHLGFVQCPSREQCPYGQHCVECLIGVVLSSKAHRPQSWSRSSQFLLDAVDNRLNLVLLGSSGLAEQLATEIRFLCLEDEYPVGNEIFSLDYRIIDGDVSLPQNSFKTADFKPHGCFCVFNSRHSLRYLVDNLRKTLLNDIQKVERLPFQGLPVVIVLAYNRDITDSDLMSLREEGQQLADRLQCPFIDVPSSLMLDHTRLFHQDQIGLAMCNLVKCIQHRSSFVQPWQITESIESDIRILMCFMCGDNFQVDLPLAPLLNHQCCYVTTDKFPTITLETYLDDSKRKVEVTVTSYHGGTQLRDDLYHGVILVYSAKRRASLCNLGAFVECVFPVPIQIIAVSESGGPAAFFSSDSEQTLIVEGNALADRLKSRFMITCANFRQQTASYTPFFKECWERKTVTEHVFRYPDNEQLSLLQDSNNRVNISKSSASNSQSTDSDPIYDHPHPAGCLTDSDYDEQALPRVENSQEESFPGVSDLFIEPDTEHLLKPSQIKSKRVMYAGDDGVKPVQAAVDNKSAPPVFPKPRPDTYRNKPSIGTLDLKKYGDVCAVLHHTLSHPSSIRGRGPSAPLATPEHIEISDYAQVKDALPAAENAYASVANALPSGHIHRIRSTFKQGKHGKLRMDSDSDDCSSQDGRTESVYSSVRRQPTPHKKRNKPRDLVQGTPPLPPYTDDRQVLVNDDQLESLHQSASGSEGTGDEQRDSHRVKKKRSFRSRRQPLMSDIYEGKSTADDDNFLDTNSSAEFSPRYKDKVKDSVRKDKEEKKKKKEEERRQKEQQKLRKKIKGRPGIKSQNSTPWGTVEDQRQSDDKLVPLFVEKCVTYIEQTGLNLEGLYRVPGNKAQVDILIDKFTEDPAVDIASLDIQVNAVATALKYFFAELLTEPLIPNAIYDDLVSATGCTIEERLASLREILQRIPNANQVTLKYIIRHLVRVTENAKDNSMSSQNLAICWWPTLLRPHISSLEKMASMATYLADIIQIVIDNHRYMFLDIEV